MERRLAAILAYDVVGYILAMGRDEADKGRASSTCPADWPPKI